MKELSKGLQVNILGYTLRIIRATSLFLAAYLYDAQNFGIYTLVWANAEVILKFTPLGLEQGLLFELSYLQEQEDKTRLYRKIASSIKVAFSFSVLASILLFFYAYFFVDGEEIRRNMYFVAPLVPLNTLGMLFIHATMALKEMKYKVYLKDSLEPSLFFLSLFLFFWIPILKPYGIVLSQCVSLFFSFVFSIVFFRKFFSFRTLFRELLPAKNYRALIRYALPMHLIEVFDIFLFRSDIYMMSYFLGTGTAAQQKLFGVYGLAKQITRALILTKNAFGPIFVAVSSEQFLKKERNQLWETFLYSFDKLLLLNLPFALALFCFGKELLLIFGSDSGLINFPTFLWLLIGQLLYSTAALFIYLLIVTVRYTSFLLIHFLILFSPILFGALWVPKYGALGGAMVSGVAYSLVAVAGVWEVQRIFHRSFLTKNFFKIILAGFVSILLTLGLKHELFSNLPITWKIAFSFTPALILYFVIALPAKDLRKILFWRRQAT